MRSIIVGIMVGIGIMVGTATANAYPVEITGPATVAEINKCNDGLPVYWDTYTHEIYGDQDGNGKLDGADCDWQ